MTEVTTPDNDSDLSLRLRFHPSFRGGKLRMHRQEKQVTVQGTVPTYYDKQMIQELIRQLDNVDEVINNLIVEPRRD